MTEEFQFSELNDEEREITDKFLGSKIRKGFVRCNTFLLPDLFQQKMNDIINMDIRDDDVWICSFMKAGTTWTQEMAWCIANDLNLEKAKNTSLDDRYIYLDIYFMVNLQGIDKTHPNFEELQNMVNTVEIADRLESRRFIKTHLPYELLPAKLRAGSTKAKIIFVIRNPKDCAISSFHHRKSFGGFTGDLDEYCDLFMRNLVDLTPYWKLVLGYWNHRNNENIIFLKFEEMKKDLPAVIRKVMKFMEKDFSNNEINSLCNHLSFENMKNNPAVNKNRLTEIAKMINSAKSGENFIRSGTVNQWKKELSQETIIRFQEWEEKNLKDTNLSSFADL